MPPGYQRQQPVRRPKLGPWLGVIDAILDDDKQRPARQRHRAKWIFERLREEHSFTGGYTIARDYVRSAELRKREMFVPLTHAPCEAQADFGKAQPTAMIPDSRTLQSTPESGARAGYDGAKRRKGSKVHAAVDTLGHLLALHVTPADEQDRAQVGELARQVQQITEENVELAYVDQGYTGETAEAAAARHGIQLEVVKHTEAKRGFVLLPRRWVVERSFAWAARFRRLARDYERLATTLGAFHFLAFACLMMANLFRLLA
jgi:transposase